LLALFYFFFRYTAPTAIYTLSLHDALPISVEVLDREVVGVEPDHAPRALDLDVLQRLDQGVGILRPRGLDCGVDEQGGVVALRGDRKSTRLNSSHVKISYAVFCLKKKTQK